MKQSADSIPIWPSIRKLLKLSGRFNVWLVLALIFDTLMAATAVASSHFMRRFFDAVTVRDTYHFWFYTAAFVAVGLLDMLSAFLRTRSVGIFGERALAGLRRSIASQVTGLPVRYLEDRHTGDLLSILNADLAKLRKLLTSDLVGLVGQLTRALGALIYIFILSWQLTLAATVLTPVLFWIVSALTAPISRRTDQMQEEIGRVNSLAQDGLAGLVITRAFNLTRVLDERFRLSNNRVLSKGMRIAFFRALVDIVGYVVTLAPFMFTFGFGGWLVLSGRMTFGSIFAFINLLNLVANPLTNIPNLWAGIGEAAGAAQRLFRVLDQPRERQAGDVRQSLPEADPLIQLEDVTFAYPGQTPILQGISLEIRRGEKVAIVGPSGSGKTTLLKLLLGFYPLEGGQLRLFGAEIQDWHLPDLRRQMAFVAQDTYLFPVGVGENIACGRPGADQAEVEAAARAANIHDFILTLPEQYRTPVGERGARLSGGERQRISLARAILKDAPLLLLDEATSALDTESEALVQEAVDRFMAGRTSIVIAHRLSTIKNADRVLVLDRGRIVESGTHAELFAHRGLYHDLYLTQFVNAAGSGAELPVNRVGVPVPQEGASHA
jgi:ABC-type multidrug transport system fused ATPase/permease subunit